MSDNASSLAYHRSVGSSRSSLLEMTDDPDYTPNFDLGMRLEIQQLYRPSDRLPWSESVPDKIATNVEASSYAQECALIIHREPHPITNEISLHSITVQSPLIRKVLQKTFKGFEGLNIQLKQLVFKAPFHSFYYRWHLFEKLREYEQDEDTKKHLDLLYSVLGEELAPHIEVMQDFTKNEVISFDYLWTIFAPGMQVYTKLDGQDRLMELTDSRYGASMGGEFFTLEYKYIDCDGSNSGYVSSSVDIEKFEGVKKIVDLDAFPSHLHNDVQNLVNRLHERGRKFEELNGFHHVSYSGYYTARSSRQIRKRHVENGRIIVDSHTFNVHGTPGPGLGSIGSGVDSHADVSDDNILANVHNMVYRATNQAFQRYQNAVVEIETRAKHDFRNGSKALRPDQHLICTPVVRGYCLAFKTWAEFYIENISPISWNANAFSRLVLPYGYKDIIRAFVQEQLSHDDGFDDIIYGKGLGFIMLLSGDPGVGKTLTAESVAEELRRPLYMMSASELGETATEVEESLEQVLLLANEWNAILLLDECDMFLEARSAADIRRNRLVSVFLRQLEYYRGVMFLTSNRISDFDKAFESRIHLTIHYPALDVPSRFHVWKTFVQMGDVATQLVDKDLEFLATIEVNGRQIKNTIKTARLLSKQENAPLALEHIMRVIRVKEGSLR